MSIKEMSIFSSATAMLEALEGWSQLQQIRPLDYAFAKFLSTNSPTAVTPLSLLLAAYCSYQPSIGNICFNLTTNSSCATNNQLLPPAADTAIYQSYSPAQLLNSFSSAELQAALEQDRALVTRLEPQQYNQTVNTPLVLQQQRLYLQRFWHYEQQIYRAIQQKLSLEPLFDAALNQQLQQSLASLFPPSEEQTSAPLNWQKLACAIAYRSMFAVITGGPGTGKTTTVVKLIALLLRLQSSQPKLQPLKIALAAPTGKAAARLVESISNSINSHQQLFSQLGVLQQMPTQCSTLHRLLGYNQHSFAFKHNAANPLNLDVLVVDEASMMDLKMLYALLQALPQQCRLILLGDKDQLASVDAGAILSQLCQRAGESQYRADSLAWLQQVMAQPLPELSRNETVSALQEAVVMLKTSYRFNAASGMGQLAQAVNAADAASAELIWQQPHPDLHQYGFSAQQQQEFKQLICGDLAAATNCHGYRHYLNVMAATKPTEAVLEGLTAAELEQQLAVWAKQVLTAWHSFQLLCCVLEGDYGVLALNQRIENYLRQQRLLISATTAQFYAGRPVMMTKNDYVLRLMNGDVGMTFLVPERQADGTFSQRLMVAFPDAQAQHGIRWVLPRLLDAVDSVFAMTVHKSQGSEFSNVALVLPNYSSQVLSKQLYYTAITRAKQNFILIYPAQQADIINQVVRTTGQRQAGMDFFAN